MSERLLPVRTVAPASRRPDLRLDWCSHEAARYACERWHYSGTIPTNRTNQLGVWEDGSFRGSILFSLSATPSLGSPYGLNMFEVCELARVALRSHVNAVSRMITIAVRLVSQRNSRTRLIVSFADPMHDHHGGIYQAAGWIYSGTTDASSIWKMPDGRLIDPRRFNGHGFNAPKRVPRSAQLLQTPGKHRYLLPLDAEMRDRIAPLAQPYPKRVKQATDGHHPVGGGAAPTHTLQVA